MSIDVNAETLIDRPKEEVASFAMNAENDPIWIDGISEARMLTDPPMAEGTQVERVARFLGRRIRYVNEVVEYDPEALLVMRSIKGPFPMTITYQFDEAESATLARIRVQGDAVGFYRLAAPVLSRAVKRSITNDLKSLKHLLESEPQAQGASA